MRSRLPGPFVLSAFARCSCVSVTSTYVSISLFGRGRHQAESHALAASEFQLSLCGTRTLTCRHDTLSRAACAAS